MVFDDKYQFLFQHFSEDVIANRYAAWLDEIQTTVIATGGEDYFFISEDNLSLAVLDYFTDIARLKPFQDIEHTNVQKIYAYGTYWMLKRSPVQQKAIVPPEFYGNFAYMNEKVLLLILLPKIIKEMGLEPAQTYIKGRSIIMPFVNLLFYNFRFRLFTPQTLEMALDGFFSGYKLGCNIQGVQ